MTNKKEVDWRFISMETTNVHPIVLPKGEAFRPFFELTESERREVGLKIFRHVTELAAKVGQLPVTSQTLQRKPPGIKHSF
jgi:hypothetical protein